MAGMALHEATWVDNRARKITFWLLAVLVAVSLGVLFTANPAHAKTFTVNSTSDASDDALNGTCDADPRVFVVRCTLRAAIEEANERIRNPGADTINFNIPSTDPTCNATTRVCTISPASTLPLITEAVTINGYTQRPCSTNPAPCSRPNTAAVGNNAVLLIQLNGASGSSSAGLWINASNSVVKGLVINRFGKGIIIGIDNIGADPSTGNTIAGNFIGTDPSGTLDRGNRDSGVSMAGSGSNNTVGGTTPAVRNLISGNGHDGISIHNSPATGNQVLGNYIGTDKSGTANLGNDWNGVQLRTANNTIGDNTGAGANVIAFNGQDPSFNNGTHGVLVVSDLATGNRILRNSIFSNTGLGIDLGGNGRTTNDVGDADTGSNNLQNFPVLISAETPFFFDAPTTIKGRLNSTPGTTFVIRFFSNPSGDEGKRFIGQKTDVVTDSSGNASFSFTPNQRVEVGQRITATATDPNGNTSEFSAAREVTRGGFIGGTAS
jgi:CSLREA domain-containing protein